jgi:beta-phosphoglucomutase-like phosphatase (HAD superfamily)
MKQYDYILLDWDGNLAKTLDLWLDTFRQVLDEEGFHPTDEEITASFGKTDEFFAKLGVY